MCSDSDTLYRLLKELLLIYSHDSQSMAPGLQE